MAETSAVDAVGGEADLIVVGGGPAGCAAVVMAAGLGMRSVLVESDEALCRALERIPVLGNVLGFSTGPALAAAITADVGRCDLCRVELGRRAVRIGAHADRVEVATVPARASGPGLLLTAPYAVVATGVGPLRLEDAGWIDGHEGLALPPLWEADPAALTGRTALVLGADRPLGTYLRAHPGLESRFVVACPPGDAYKAEEVAQDPRVELVPVRHLTLAPPSSGQLRVPETPLSAESPLTAEVLTVEGDRRTLTGHRGFRNLGSGPMPPGGDLSAEASGYCPPSHQHPRVFTAGDLRSARFQRIATAMGSGSEAALGAYYASRGLPTEVTDDVPPRA
ncbi:pyridine nucleotide-disulfide oxidoreductase [Streptomyces sp. ME19-01-6]|uniref:pyridine nucleotide-disulfide oxidoreductase n=1 Tax=Streptomyces sp. ME19-01-6 TaxID=3028686 RepID=UPI0029AFD8D1|nr:pyridine nucleotide-disulfide oxidoreductase [Streptomyces sp. ME19-01-6]MDX3226181.1 pyridine nucleotide-disulfide oxidoreductase [Streptomyces sp. ME19-01-6]